jgi:polyhydroxybutyrate depolymerase
MRIGLIVLLIFVILFLGRRFLRWKRRGKSSISSGGLHRTYDVHIKPNYPIGVPLPLVIALSGRGGTGQGMAMLTQFNVIADRENFIVVYPDAIDAKWNDGRVEGAGIDDVAFISDLIDKLSNEFNIDTKRVFITGMSNGAVMAHRLACELSLKVAAIAAVAGNIPVIMAPKWEPQRAIPVMIINGTKDPIEPWNGGKVHFGMMMSVAETVKFWVNKNQCTISPLSIQLPNNGSKDGTSVRVETYAGGKSCTEVILYSVEGGGHTWPGGRQYLPKSIIGKTSRQFNASEVIWQFFKKHAMQD